MGRPWSLVTAGAVMAGVGASYICAYVGYISYGEVLPMTAIVLGFSLLLEGVVKELHPTPGEMESVATLGWGILILAIGIIGDLSARGYPLTVLLAAFTILLGALAVFSALRMSKGRTLQTEKTKQQKFPDRSVLKATRCNRRGTIW